MSDLARLQTALVNADAAGDVEAATQFAQEIRRLQTPQVSDPTEGMSFLDKAAAGAGKAMVDTYRGVSNLFGADNQAEIDEAKRLDAPLMNTAGGMVGNVAGNLATMIGPGAALGAVGKAAQLPRMVSAARAVLAPQTLPGAAAVGAGLGAAQPVASDESRLTNTALGAAGGLLGNAIPRGVGRVLSPQTSPEVATLMREGVTPTPGQILGGGFQRAEEGATSLPIIGDAIKSGQRRAVEDLNRAAYNRALAPIGEQAGKDVGNEGVAEVAAKISKRYDEILPKLSVTADPQFGKDMQTLVASARQLPESRTRQFETILRTQLLERFDDTGSLAGAKLKQAESTLGRLAATYKNSSDADSRLLGEALQGTQASLRELIARSNPDFAPELQAANEAWANLVRIENAAGKIGAKEGVFSPAQLRNAVRGSDKSLRKRNFAQGNALMQDLADAGEKVLGQKVPDSGTPFRTANIAAALGGAYFNPAALGGALGAAGLYSRPGQSLMAGLLTSRPQALRGIGSGIEDLAPYLVAPSTLGLLGLSQ
jgi:hypothetical protein